MFKKLRTVVYHVTNIAEARDWYVKATGIEPYFDQPFYVGFDIHGYELGLDPDMTGVQPGNMSYPFWAVDNLDESIQHLQDLGAIVVQPKTNVGGETFVATLNDPWGNSIGLIQES